MPIFVKMHTGKTLTVNITKNSSIAYIKAKIQDMENIPLEERRRSCAGEQLKDLRTLKHYNIQKDITLCSYLFYVLLPNKVV